jgi:hypothetical protein
LARLDAAPYRGDAAVWFSFHFYEPLLYTHQEITWLSPGSYRYVSRLPWPEDPHRTGAALVEALRRLADDATLDSSRRERLAAVLRRDFADYATAGTAAHVARRFDEVTRWAGREDIPPTRLLLGEYGVDRPTHSAAGAPWPDAAAWLGAVHGEAVRRGFMPVVWDLDSGFAVICQHEGLDAQLCEDYRRALR